MKIVVVGAGGHARSVCDVLLDEGRHEVLGLLDPRATQGFLGLPILGGDEQLEALLRAGQAQGVHVALGDNRVRMRILQKAVAMGYTAVNAISPHAVVSRFATLGQGVAAMPGAVVGVCAAVGDGCILNTNSSIDHDVRLGGYCHIAPGVAVSGGVTVGEGTFLGVGARVIDGIAIGAWTMVGGGAAVIRDLPDHCTAVGVPARVIKREREAQ